MQKFRTTDRLDLLPFKRYKVYYRPEGARRCTAVVTLGGRPPTRTTLLGNPVLSFADQETGNLFVVGADLVDRVEVQQADRSAEWHTVGRWPVKE